MKRELGVKVGRRIKWHEITKVLEKEKPKDLAIGIVSAFRCQEIKGTCIKALRRSWRKTRMSVVLEAKPRAYVKQDVLFKCIM